jgi:SAM-dependent methyltransferase
MNPIPQPCPLCEAGETFLFHRNDQREFRRCRACRLTFVPASHHLGRADELARYRTHQNRPDDPAYRAFLDRLAQHLAPKLEPGASGLDYGSGPGPTLSVMLEEQGFAMRLYDPFFAPDERALRETYDFITCTETVEHFARPAAEFGLFARLLRPGGWLGVMTQLLENDETFPGWWYHRDPTHIAFYRPETMRWIAARHHWRIETPSPSVTLFHRAAESAREDPR